MTQYNCYLNYACFDLIWLQSQNDDAPSGTPDPKFGPEVDYIDCIQNHLKKFVFQEFQGKRCELAFLKFIAERAQVLEKMVVIVGLCIFLFGRWCVKAKLKPLASAKWASEDCKLIVFNNPLEGRSPAWHLQIAPAFSWSDPFDLLTAGAEINGDAFVLHHSRRTLNWKLSICKLSHVFLLF